MSEIQRVETNAIQQANPSNPIAAMLSAITEHGVTSDNAAALEKMTDLYLKMEGINAKKQFASALAQLQAELPRVVATKAVPNNDGTVRYTYAPYAEIMRAIDPLLVKHGFAISFSQRVEDSRLVAICSLSHIGGHSENNEFAVRAGKGPPGSSEAQADGASSTYARRQALCNRFNIVVDDDDDARLLGAFITDDQAARLKARLVAVGGNEAGFLKLAGASSFAEIRTGKYAMLDAALSKKEAKTPADTTKSFRSYDDFRTACIDLVAGTDVTEEQVSGWVVGQAVAFRKNNNEPISPDVLSRWYQELKSGKAKL